MSTAKLRYPNRLDHTRWCPNGAIPDAFFIRQAADALNHALAYRRKVVMTAHAAFNTMSGAGTKNYWRSRFRSGLAARALRFKILAGLDQHTSGDPHIDIDVTISGGVTTTVRLDYGSTSGLYIDDEPFTLSEFRPEIEIDPLTTYEINVKGVDGGRPIAVSAIEVGVREVDDSINYFAELAPSVFQPVNDDIREKILVGLSETWLANGAHLLSWCGNGLGTARTITGTTSTNIVDGTSTAVSASTPGFVFGSAGSGLRALSTLKQLCRLRQSNDLPVTFCAYAQTSTGTGQVFIRETGGVGGVNLNGITTTLQWHSADTTWQNVDAIAGSGKFDIQARHSTSGVATISVYAVALYTRAT